MLSQGVDRLTAGSLIRRDRDAVAPALYRFTDVVMERGAGVEVFDVEGRRYLDFAAGIGVLPLGHCPPKVVAAVREQAGRLMHAAAHVGYMRPYVELAERLRAVTPAPLCDGKVMWVNSGSEAVEAAVKLARYATGRPMAIAFLDGFHGRTMGALGLTATTAGYRRHLTALLGGVHHVPYPNPSDREMVFPSPDGASRLSLRMVEKALETIIPPEELACIVVEAVASEGGVVVPPDGFIEGLRKICDRAGALLVLDEVFMGLGRTGRWFGFEHTGIVPDIVSVGKAVGGGLPLGGVLARAETADRWPSGAHGSTFGGNPLSCAAGLATLDVMHEEGVVDNARRVGASLAARVRDGVRGLPHIGEVRGRGMVVGIEILDHMGKPDNGAARVLVRELAQAGLLTTKAGLGTVRLTPPLILTEVQVQEGVDLLLRVLRGWKGSA
jgi:4-aminobutyrate aminotransferase